MYYIILAFVFIMIVSWWFYREPSFHNGPCPSGGLSTPQRDIPSSAQPERFQALGATDGTVETSSEEESEEPKLRKRSSEIRHIGQALSGETSSEEEEH